MIVGLLYGWQLVALLPTDERMSWQGHLFGFLGRLFAAIVFRRRREPGAAAGRRRRLTDPGDAADSAGRSLPRRGRRPYRSPWQPCIVGQRRDRPASASEMRGIQMLEVDVAIVGAGPTGLFAAYYAGFRGLSTAVIDALPEPGGQVTAMYPEKAIFDVAGFPAIKGRDLVANLVAQAGAVQPDLPARRTGREAELRSRTAGPADSLRRHGAALRRGADHRRAGQLHARARCRPPTHFSGEGVLLLRQAPGRPRRPRRRHRRRRRLGVRLGAGPARRWPSRSRWSTGGTSSAPTPRRWPGCRRCRSRSSSTPRSPGCSATARVTGCEVMPKGGEARVLPADTVVAALGFTADLGPLAEWGLDARQAAHHGRLHDGDEPAPGLRGRRHLRVPRQGAADRGRASARRRPR